MTKADIRKMEANWTWYVFNGWIDDIDSKLATDEKWRNNTSMVIMMTASEFGRGVKTAPDGLYQ